MFETILDVILDALKDSVIMLPIIFICYLLIELLEEKILDSYQSNKVLKSKFAPVLSAGFGLIPQCGFSVVATDLYSKRVITVGSLMAIYLATSDEALPLMLSSPDNYLNLALILVIKFVYAVIVGLVIDLIFKSKRQPQAVGNVTADVHGCCNHDLEHEHKIRETFLHPLKHSLKIFALVLVINIIFGSIVAFVGEDAISNFMLSTGFFEPFLVGLVGMIPNCSASVIITELFMSGSIKLGSCLAGLCANSGIAVIVLFRLNKKPRDNVFIATSLYLLGVLLGVIVNLF